MAYMIQESRTRFIRGLNTDRVQCDLYKHNHVVLLQLQSGMYLTHTDTHVIMIEARNHADADSTR